jgi:hypothetical protein
MVRLGTDRQFLGFGFGGGADQVLRGLELSAEVNV